MNLSIPLNSHVNTSDDYIITDINTQDKTVLNKKNTLKYKAVLSPMFYKGENKVFTTSGHTITKTNNQTLTDENGRTYAIDNSFVVASSADISTLWSGELTSAICKDEKIYSVWKGERDYTLVISDFDNNILKSVTKQIDTTNLLYYNVKLANYTREASKADGTIILVVQIVKTDPQTTIAEYSINDTTGTFTLIERTNYNYLTGKDLYVLCYRKNDTNYVAVGTDDTDIRKRFTFENGAVKYKYYGCLGSNGLLTGEPVYSAVSNYNGKISTVTVTEPTLTHLQNGIGYVPTFEDTVSGSTDAQWISANTSLSTDTITDNTAPTWGGINHTRTSQKAWIAGYDLEKEIPLIISASIARENNSFPSPSNISRKSTDIIPLDDAYFSLPGNDTNDGKAKVGFELVDFSDGLGNFVWSAGTTAEIANGCNPFPMRYSICNRADSKGRYWDYGPGWCRSYIREATIGQWGTNKRIMYERFPTAIVSYGLNSATNLTNSVRIESLSPTTFDVATSYTAPQTENGKWTRNSQSGNFYYRLHKLGAEAHIWTDFIGADNLGNHSVLDSLPFQVDILPDLNVKDQYYSLNYMSTSMQGTLLTSASIKLNALSTVFCEDDNTASLFSNGIVLYGKRNGDIKLEKVADYIYKTNSLIGNNLFVDSKENFLGQRAFIAYNGEEVIDLSNVITFTPPHDDTDTDGNDTYYTASGYNAAMNDMNKRGVSYLLPVATFQMIVKSDETENLTFQMIDNKKEITKPLLAGTFTYKDDPVDHYYAHSLDSTSVEYQTSKKLESSASDNETKWYGVSTYNNDNKGFVWWITSTVQIFPLGIASIITGINFLASTVDMTDNYTVRLYRTSNVTFPVYNPTTEVYKGSTIFTIYGYNYSFDGQSVYYLGSGDDTSQSSFACYALGMQFLANSGTEAYFYSPFEKRLYLFTGSNTLQIADSLAREGKIIDSLYSSCEQILYLLTDEGNVIAKSQDDMAMIEKVDTSFHFEGTDSGMILSDGFNYKKYRLYQTDETEWLPIEFETEYLGKNNSYFKTAIAAVTFFNFNDKTVEGKLYWDLMSDNMPKRVYVPFKITAKDWEPTKLKKIEFAAPNNVGKAFRIGIESNDYVSIADIMVNVEEVSQNTNAPLHV